MVYRIYVEKKKELANEARGLLSDINSLLGIKSVSDLRVINRYDVEDIEKEDVIDYLSRSGEKASNTKDFRARMIRSSLSAPLMISKVTSEILSSYPW